MKQKLTRSEHIEKMHFNKIAKNYDTNYGYNNEFTKNKIIRKSKELANFIQLYNNKKKLRILEIGCGTGEYTYHIASSLKDVEIISIDISEEIVDIARQKCKRFKNVKFEVKSAYGTAYKAKSFDIICGFYILHHLNLDKLSREVDRLAKKDGLLFFYEPNILNPIVYFIKSNKWIKNWVGDSPDEWAINPLTIQRKFTNFHIKTTTSEFIIPFSKLNKNLLIGLDKFISKLKMVPIIKYLGGSVRVVGYKK